MKTKILVASLLASILVVACGPDWNDCGTCSTQTTEDGGTTPPPETDAGTPPVVDAGTPPVDAGTPPCDAGTPPKPKWVCKDVCTCEKTEYVCSNGHTYDYNPHGCGTCVKKEVCTATKKECKWE